MREESRGGRRLLPVFLMEPASTEKRRHYQETLTEPRKTRQLTPDEIRQKLREIRLDSMAHLGDLVDMLTASLTRNPGVAVTFAQSADEATATIKGIAGDLPIAINKSATVSTELKGQIVASGCRVFESYDSQFEAHSDNPGTDRRFFPGMTFEARFQSFQKQTDLAAARTAGVRDNGTKDFVGLLGVNAISAEDGSILILQHMSNIGKVFEQAREVILVAGLDKIVRTLEDAVFQTRCIAVFGVEALPLSVPGTAKQDGDIDQLPYSPPVDETPSRIHVILLDNDRTRLLESAFKDFFLCIGCRSCIASCPAHLSAKPLSPRDLISKFKKYLPQVGPNLLEGEARPFPAARPDGQSTGAISEDEIWACTTCRVCEEVCPAKVRPVEGIMGLRQNLAMVSTSNPSSKAIRNPLRNMELRGHPWMGVTLNRRAWTEGLDIRTMAEGAGAGVLYWVGCTGLLDERGMKIVRDLGRIMKQAGIDFRILGEEESCCGDPARRLGNEYLFERQAEKNVDTLRRYGIRRIVTACPHCYNVLKNEYPQFGVSFDVVHHTEMLDLLLREGKIGVDTAARRVVTYQDPCYLSRYNGVCEAPRQVLRRANGSVVEMPRNRERSFCCGGGGGRMWLEESTGRRIGEMRLEQALETGATTLATSCPFCLQMFEDAAKTKGVEGSLAILDVVELLER